MKSRGKITTFFVICILFLKNSNCIAQNLFSKTIKQFESGSNFSTSNYNPFWIRSNQKGKVSINSNYFYVNGGINKEYDSTYSKNKKLKYFDVGYGVDLSVTVGKINSIFISELYIKSRFKDVDFSIGRKNFTYGIADSTLTSGSIIHSGNALSIPRIVISIPNYVSIIGKGLFSIKGAFSHGWFEQQTFTKNFYLHEKHLYGKFGRPNWRINLQSGINNQVIWGGYSETLKNNSLATYNGHLPSDFNAFLSSAFPFKFVKKIFPPEYSIWFDEVNYSGNILGSVDFAIQINSKKGKFLLYRQIPYELGSLFSSLVNADDGLYGISYATTKQNTIIKKVTLEGFHSYNQGSYRSGIASLFGLKDRHYGELNNYFNHGQYLDGWSYNGRTIGTPIMIGNNEINLSKYGAVFGERSSYNQVKLLFLGINANFKTYNLISKTSFGLYRRSQGYYLDNNFNIPQFCTAIEASKFIKKGLGLNSKIGFDSSGILNQSLGIQVGVKKVWL